MSPWVSWDGDNSLSGNITQDNNAPVPLLTFTQHVHISPVASHAVQDTAISSKHTEKKQKAPP